MAGPLHRPPPWRAWAVEHGEESGPPLGRTGCMGLAAVCKPKSAYRPVLISYFFCFFNLNPRNLVELQKFIEICIKIRKNQNKFWRNPCEHL
jgi:hypothetical protein